MRKQLELYALQLAFPKLTDEHRGHWQAIIRKLQRAGEDQNVQEVLNHDAAFHQQLLISAGLIEMIPIWQGVYARMRDHHQRGNREYSDLRIVAHVHSRLIDSLFSGDFERALTDWESHLENGVFNTRARASWQRHSHTTEKEG